MTPRFNLYSYISVIGTRLDESSSHIGPTLIQISRRTPEVFSVKISRVILEKRVLEYFLLATIIRCKNIFNFHYYKDSVEGLS